MPALKKKPVKKTVIKTETAESDNLKDIVEKILDDNKATDISVIDIRGKSSIGDYIIIASGTSARHAASLADKVFEAVKPVVSYPITLEGKAQGDWVLVDAGGVIVHIFRPEVREFYNIEKIWNVSDTEKQVIRVGKK